jgi:hypothetical protein
MEDEEEADGAHGVTTKDGRDNVTAALKHGGAVPEVKRTNGHGI